MSEEIFKDCPGYPDNYWVTNRGRVVTKKTGLNRKFRTTWDGYYDLTLWDSGKSNTLRVHRLVAIAFIPNPDNLPVTNHKDGNKLNNHVDNLEWTTVRENTIHSYRNGLQKPVRGSKHGRSKYREEDIIKVCELLTEGHNNKYISGETGVSVRTIQSILTRNNWKHISKDYVFPDRRRKKHK